MSAAAASIVPAPDHPPCAPARAFGRAAAADPVSAHWPREQARAILDQTSGEPDDAATDEAMALLRRSAELDSRASETWTQLAVAFARAGLNAVGFDVDGERTAAIARGESYVLDVPDGEIRTSRRPGRGS